MKERIASRNISHPKFLKKIKRLYHRGHITEENYNYLLFQKEVYEDSGTSLETWSLLNKEAFERHKAINEETIIAVMYEWAY